MEINMKDIQIRILKADNPKIDVNLFNGYKADLLIKHFITEYPSLVYSLLIRTAFYFHIYPYLKMMKTRSLNDIYTQIARDYQTLEIKAYQMN